MQSFDDILSMHAEEYLDLNRDNIYRLGEIVNLETKEVFRPKISYTYLNIRLIPDFCFNHQEFSEGDYKIYFSKIKKICNTTYESLIQDKNKDLDFMVYSKPNKDLLKCFKLIVGDKYLTEDRIPPFGRIGLYNSKKKGDKAPRIFFFVGHECVIHILLFDAYHALYPDDLNYLEN